MVEEHDEKEDKKEEQPEHEHKDSHTEETETDRHHSSKKQSLLEKAKHYRQWLLTHKKVSIPLAAALLVLLVAVVPQTRYGVLGMFFKQSFAIIVADADTSRPVSSASVMLDGKKATTDSEGKVVIKTSVGYAKLQVAKKYYNSLSREVVVPLGKPSTPFTVELKATGRPVPITIINKISQKPAADVVITAAGTEAKTDKNGKATLVVPLGKKEIAVTLGGQGYSSLTANLRVVTEEVAANTFQIAPAGTIYFLSNASGKIDLVKSNLDGSNRKIVLPGTGKEDRFNTVLFASRDWKYIALLSKRDGGEYAKLFLVEADTDKVTTIDEGKANFDIRGWSDDRLVYQVDRNKQYWETKRQAIKSYQASTKKLTTLDETTATGSNAYDYVAETYGSVYVLDQAVIYVKNWDKGYYSQLNDKKAIFNSMQADGSQKKTLKSYDYNAIVSWSVDIETRPAEFGEIYIRRYLGENNNQFDEYKNGKVTTSKITIDEYNNETYPSYSVSPSGKRTLWSDYRDGKNVFFVGNSSGEDGKQIGSSEDYSAYGWYTDDYILLTRKGSEMHIMPAEGLTGGVEKSLKISDYYKPNYSNRGFGYGYGG